MNNEQFRKLVLDKPGARNGASATPLVGATPSILGSRRSGFIPMTPRNIKGGSGVDFAKQVAERNAAGRPAKKFKSFGPRGVKLAAGYTDRALSRLADEDEDGDDAEEKDDRAERLEALEEQVKLGQLDRKMFEKIRDEITGGDVGATHLVKGLDRQLLERVRRGEDVMSTDDGKPEEPAADVDDELEALEDKELAPVEREKKVKKGEMAPPSQIAGSKRSRDAIMAELKAQRAAAAAARVQARPDLGDKFRSIEARNGPKIVKDHKGREVLITKDEHGNIKKKIRKAAPEPPPEPKPEERPTKLLDEDTFIPQLKSTPVPAEESDDDDIFEGAGTAYNPLGDDDADSDSNSEDEAAAPVSAPPAKVPANEDDLDEGEVPTEPTVSSPQPHQSEPTEVNETNPPEPPEPAASKPRNYFNTPTLPTQSINLNPMSDPTFLSAIKRASDMANIKINLTSSAPADPALARRPGETEEVHAARLKRRAEMLANVDRDAEDMDMGFGSSRFADAEEEEDEGDVGKGKGKGKKGKLSEWKGLGREDEEAEDKGGKKKKPRPKKGKESAKDVLGVLERRKKEDTK